MVAELSPRQEIWRGLLYGQRSIMVHVTAALKRDFGLTAPHYEALFTLWEAPGRTLPTTALAQSLLYGSGSASHLIDRLVELGYVARTSRPGDWSWSPKLPFKQTTAVW